MYVYIGGGRAQSFLNGPHLAIIYVYIHMSSHLAMICVGPSLKRSLSKLFPQWCVYAGLVAKHQKG
jgi:hypothetical protein